MERALPAATAAGWSGLEKEKREREREIHLGIYDIFAGYLDVWIHVVVQTYTTLFDRL